MINIAFIHTAYQQNILLALSLQEGFLIDVLLVRDNVIINNKLNSRVNKIIRYKNFPFTIKNIIFYYKKLFNNKLKPELNNNKYRILTWTLLHPFVRYTINYTDSNNIYIFEDGTGSYINWGKYNKDNLRSKILLPIITNAFGLTLKLIKNNTITGWSLYEDCYPEMNIKKKIIESKYFKNIIETTVCQNNKKNILCDNSAVFITSPYTEYGIMNKSEYIKSIHYAVKTISDDNQNLSKIYWKLHPNSNRIKEQIMLEKVNNEIKIHIAIINSDDNIETLALMNNNNKIGYYSFASTALYVIKSLNLNNSKLRLINCNTLKNVFDYYPQLLNLYKNIGIKILNK